MIPRETVDTILETAKVEEVVGEFVSLKRRGSSYVACCPFHNEKTPSFHVTPSRGIYKCFGCGKAGTAVGFLMDYERLTYPEALRYLAKKYNIEVKEQEETADQIAARQRNESLLAATEFAGKFFREQLLQGEGRAIGYQYFRSRGLLDETIEKWGLGWAPRDKESFTTAARAAGYKDEYLEETGLCSKWESDGSLHDRFYERVIFPVHSVSGRIIAFGGRTLLKEKSDKIAKYVNSKESEIYVKSRSLYGIYFAKTSISKEDRCYLMEGYLDVLSMHQAGITNCVASSGTSLTEEQIRIIRRFTNNVTIMYDGDSAGLHAAIRAIDMILKEGMNPRVVFLPDGDDPDSYSRKHTLEEIKEFIADNEKDGVAFKTDLRLSEAGDDPLRRANLINEIADTVALIPDTITRQVYIDTVAKKFGIEVDIIRERVSKTRREAKPREELRPREEVREPVKPELPQGAIPEVSVTERCERDLMEFILDYGKDLLHFESDSDFYNPDGEQTVAEFIDDALAADEVVFENPVYARAYDAYFTLYDKGLEQDTIVKSMMDGEDREVADVTARLTTEEYELSVKNYRDALTTHDSWLVTFVPKAILAYHYDRVCLMEKRLDKELESAARARQDEILVQLGKFAEMKKTLNRKLGREKK
ncbi:MAG: DNA primase [Bacteroidales bacterium]|nr:DNA primase [Bacteroidales bacterium]